MTLFQPSLTPLLLIRLIPETDNLLSIVCVDCLLTLSYLLLPRYVFGSKMLQKRAVVMVFLGFAGNGSGGGFGLGNTSFLP